MASLLIAPVLYILIRIAFGQPPFPKVIPSQDFKEGVHLVVSLFAWMLVPMPAGWALSHVERRWFRRILAASIYLLIVSYSSIWLFLFPQVLNDLSVLLCPILGWFGFWIVYMENIQEMDRQAWHSSFFIAPILG
jgi:hypothetical protein